MAVVDLGRHHLSYVRGGSGEPLLLIQGMAGHHKLWGEPFPALLQQDFDVINYDQRGIGDSTGAQAPFTIADLADDAAALIAALGLDSAHVVGISMGGMVAQELALRHPHRVRTLTLGCTHAGGQNEHAAGPGAHRLGAALATGDASFVVRTAFEAVMSEPTAQTPGAYELFRDTDAMVANPGETIMLQAQAVAGHDAAGRLPSLDVPTLVIHGTVDEMIPVCNAERLGRLIPGAKVELLEGVGHFFWWEAPVRTADLIRRHALGTARSSNAA